MESFKAFTESYSGTDGTGEMLVLDTPWHEMVEEFRFNKLSVPNRAAYSQMVIALAGSNKYKRHEMPVIQQQDMQRYMEFLDNLDIEYEVRDISADTLKPTQEDIHLDKVVKNLVALRDGTYDVFQGMIVATADYKIVDGHHKWATAVLSNESSRPLKTIKVYSKLETLFDLTVTFSKLQGNVARK